MELSRPLLAITNSVDGEVLGALAATTDEFTLSRLARVIHNRSLSGIRNSAERLAEQGVVTARSFGRTRVYSLNDEHLLARAIREIAQAHATLMSRLSDTVSRWNTPPQFAALFGSGARGDMTPQSDLDILLVRPFESDDDAWQSDVAALSSSATRWTGNDVRVIDLGEEELGSVGNQPLLDSVAREGLVFAGDTDWFRRMRAGHRG